jgi:hypothetical protein
VERSIVQELSGNADISFAPTGVLCIFSFPVASDDAVARHQA